MTPPATAAEKVPSSTATAAGRSGTPKARAPEAKQARAEALLQAAEAALVDASYHDITMLQIAKRAGLAKGTVYLYYPSKEALFLAVLMHKLDACFDAIDEGLKGDRQSADHIATVLTGALLGPHALLSLLSLLFSQLEPGAGMDALVDFKRKLTARISDIGSTIERSGGLKEGEGATLITRACALAIGLQQFASPPPDVIAELAIRAPELKKQPLNVEAELTSTLSDIIKARMSA
ncbi:MAG: TetR/AcrR family transcriptional regulator [Alphaproteobacteria bacterium]|nr:TetR/AcrR family transcriptional regulator [Alphaproteobacteria bacterium]